VSDVEISCLKAEREALISHLLEIAEKMHKNEPQFLSTVRTFAIQYADCFQVNIRGKVICLSLPIGRHFSR